MHQILSIRKPFVRTMLAFTLVFALTFGLTACTQNQGVRTTSEAENPKPSTTLASSSSGVTEVTTSSNEEGGEGKEASNHKYQGYEATYKTRYTEERDLLWEEEIVKIANKVTFPWGGHPHMMDSHVNVERNYPWIIYSSPERKKLNFYKPDAKKVFIERINEAIDAIPHSSDIEMGHRVNYAFAALQDIHSFFLYDGNEGTYLPIALLPAQDKDTGQNILVIYWTTTEYQDILDGKLLEINGHSIDSCTEKLWPYIPHENEHEKMQLLARYRHYLSADLLKVAGIIPDVKTVKIKVQLHKGTEKEIELQTRKDSELTSEEASKGYSANIFKPVRHSSRDIYFSKWVSEDQIYYICYKKCEDMVGKPTREEVFQKAFEEIESIQRSVKVMIDLRGNPGGHPIDHTKLLQYLHEKKIPTYVAINGTTASGAVVTATHCRQINPDVMIVGTPTAQGPNFPVGHHNRSTMINGKKFSFRISEHYIEHDFNNADDVIFPDYEVVQDYQDFVDGIDTLYEWVKAHNPENSSK